MTAEIGDEDFIRKLIGDCVEAARGISHGEPLAPKDESLMNLPKEEVERIQESHLRSFQENLRSQRPGSRLTAEQDFRVIIDTLIEEFRRFELRFPSEKGDLQNG